MKQNKETLKQFFETGDKPTQQQYADLIDSYIDSKQEAGEANRRFVIDETGEVSIASEQLIPEYTLSPISGTNTVDLLKEGVSVSQIDLTPYLDNTNLARLVRGTVDGNGLATFTRDDNSTFTVDLSNLKDNLTLADVANNGAISGQPITISTIGGGDKLVLNDANANTQSILFQNPDGEDYRISQAVTLDGRSNATRLYLIGNGHTLEFPIKTGLIATTDDIITDLSYDAATRTVASSTGTDVILPLADATNAGLQKANFYEEGTWLPKVYIGATAILPNNIKSKYIREGNKVTFAFEISSFSTVGLSGLFQIDLPFPIYEITHSGVTTGTVAYFDAGNSANSIQYTGTILNTEISSRLAFLKSYTLDRVTNSDIVFDGVNAKVNVTGTYITNVYTP